MLHEAARATVAQAIAKVVPPTGVGAGTGTVGVCGCVYTRDVFDRAGVVEVQRSDSSSSVSHHTQQETPNCKLDGPRGGTNRSGLTRSPRILGLMQESIRGQSVSTGIDAVE